MKQDKRGLFRGKSRRLLAEEKETIALEPGALTVLFTDGIPEGRNDRGEDYSVERLQRIVGGISNLPAGDICHRVIEDMRGYVCSTQPCDDVTLVVVKRTSA